MVIFKTSYINIYWIKLRQLLALESYTESHRTLVVTADVSSAYGFSGKPYFALKTGGGMGPVKVIEDRCVVWKFQCPSSFDICLHTSYNNKMKIIRASVDGIIILFPIQRKRHTKIPWKQVRGGYVFLQFLVVLDFKIKGSCVCNSIEAEGTCKGFARSCTFCTLYYPKNIG